MVKVLPALFGIVAITTLGIVALQYGVDSALIPTMIATIAGLGGYGTAILRTPPPK
jgi:hypothetical protein